MSLKPALYFGALFLILGFSVDSFGHARLTSPTPRNGQANLKTAPCGNVPRGATPTPLIGGSTITVVWEETIQHPGRFYIQFSEANDQNFIRLKEVPDDKVTGTFTTDVQIPNVDCAACTLQLIQSMEENPNNPSFYYSCADIAVTFDPTATTTTSTTTVTSTTLPPATTTTQPGGGGNNSGQSGGKDALGTAPAMPTSCGAVAAMKSGGLPPSGGAAAVIFFIPLLLLSILRKQWVN